MLRKIILKTITQKSLFLCLNILSYFPIRVNERFIGYHLNSTRVVFETKEKKSNYIFPGKQSKVIKRLTALTPEIAHPLKYLVLK
jgi:hypothetical protein